MGSHIRNRERTAVPYSSTHDAERPTRSLPLLVLYLSTHDAERPIRSLPLLVLYLSTHDAERPIRSLPLLVLYLSTHDAERPIRSLPLLVLIGQDRRSQIPHGTFLAAVSVGHALPALATLERSVKRQQRGDLYRKAT
jgi:hypothetical protein